MLTPTKDNTLIQWSPETEGANPLLSNGRGDIYVGRTNQDGQEEATISIRRGLVQFDVAGAVPSGMKITGATLAMRDVRGLNGDPDGELASRAHGLGRRQFVLRGWTGAPGDRWRRDLAARASIIASIPRRASTWEFAGGDFVETASAAAVVTDDLGERASSFAWTGDGDGRRPPSLASASRATTLAGCSRATNRAASRRSDSIAANRPTRRTCRRLLEIEFAPVLAGDYNDDGFVDAADYTVWREQLGRARFALPNETVTAGTVTAEDYDVWKSNFGAMGAGRAAWRLCRSRRRVWNDDGGVDDAWFFLQSIDAPLGDV